MSSVFDFVEDMQPYVQAGDWASLERDYARVCATLAGQARALEIALVHACE